VVGRVIDTLVVMMMTTMMMRMVGLVITYLHAIGEDLGGESSAHEAHEAVLGNHTADRFRVGHVLRVGLAVNLGRSRNDPLAVSDGRRL
jgi:hypothetical protein